MPTKVTPVFTSATTIQLKYQLGDHSYPPVKICQSTSSKTRLDALKSTSPTILHTQPPSYSQFDAQTPIVIHDLFAPKPVRPRSNGAVDDILDWSVSVNGKPAEIFSISRSSKIANEAQTDWFLFDFTTDENVLLDLATPLKTGDRVEIANAKNHFPRLNIIYTPSLTLSDRIQVNLTKASSDHSRKTAYLNLWADPGSDLQPPKTFQVIDVDSGSTAYSGQIKETQVSELRLMDFSPLSDAGEFYLVVEGIGISKHFYLGSDPWRDQPDQKNQQNLSNVNHRFNTSGAGQASINWTRPGAFDHGEGADVLPPRATRKTQTPFGPLIRNTVSDALENPWGGWQDRDDRIGQVCAKARRLIEQLELSGKTPERSETTLPARLEVAGRILENTQSMPSGTARENSLNNWDYAASAAKLAKALYGYDARLAAKWLKRATKAASLAAKQSPKRSSLTHRNGRNLAAAELYATTGKAKWNAQFLETTVFRSDVSPSDFRAEQYEAGFVYARIAHRTADMHVQHNAAQAFRSCSDRFKDISHTQSLDALSDLYTSHEWGNTTQSPPIPRALSLRLQALAKQGPQRQLGNIAISMKPTQNIPHTSVQTCSYSRRTNRFAFSHDLPSPLLRPSLDAATAVEPIATGATTNADQTHYRTCSLSNPLQFTHPPSPKEPANRPVAAQRQSRARSTETDDFIFEQEGSVAHIRSTQMGRNIQALPANLTGALTEQDELDEFGDLSSNAPSPKPHYGAAEAFFIVDTGGLDLTRRSVDIYAA